MKSTLSSILLFLFLSLPNSLQWCQLVPKNWHHVLINNPGYKFSSIKEKRIKMNSNMAEYLFSPEDDKGKLC